MLPLQDAAQSRAIGIAGSMGLFSLCQHSRLAVVIFVHNVLASDLLSHWAAVGIHCFHELSVLPGSHLFPRLQFVCLLGTVCFIEQNPG